MSGGNKRRRKKCRWIICHLGINVVQSPKQCTTQMLYSVWGVWEISYHWYFVFLLSNEFPNKYSRMRTVIKPNLEINYELKQIILTAYSGASLEGEQGEQLLPQVFGTYLGFQKNSISVDPYYVKNFSSLNSKC